jgi:cytidylate kinase
LVQKASAAGDCVIVGRGSQHVLRDRSDTLRIFLYAPRSDKVRRLAASGMGEAEVHQLVDTVDNDRAAFVEKYFHIRWPDRPVYHVMFNTAVGEQIVIDQILRLKRSLEPPECGQ